MRPIGIPPRADQGRDALLSVLDAVTCGGILLDSSKRIVQMSARARQHVGDGTIVKCGRLCATDRWSDSLLQTSIDAHLQVDYRRPAPPSLALRRSEKRPLFVRVLAVEPTTPDQDAGVLLILLDPDECPQPSLATLEQVFGLTRGEAQVAIRLMCGESLREIATALRVGVETVRTRVKSIFAKTQTNRQAELVAVLTRLALIA